MLLIFAQMAPTEEQEFLPEHGHEQGPEPGDQVLTQRLPQGGWTLKPLRCQSPAQREPGGGRGWGEEPRDGQAGALSVSNFSIASTAMLLVATREMGRRRGVGGRGQLEEVAENCLVCVVIIDLGNSQETTRQALFQMTRVSYHKSQISSTQAEHEAHTPQARSVSRIQNGRNSAISTPLPVPNTGRTLTSSALPPADFHQECLHHDSYSD